MTGQRRSHCRQIGVCLKRQSTRFGYRTRTFDGSVINRRAHRVHESLRFVRAAHDYDRYSATIKNCVHGGPEEACCQSTTST